MMKDVHKHERAKHPGQPLTKLAKGGKAFKKGGPTSEDRMRLGKNMARAMNQKTG